MTCETRLIVTNVQALGTTPLTAPILEQALWTLDAAAALTGKTENAISIMLCRRPDLFDPPHYRRGQRNVEHRLVTSRDIATIRALSPIYVKEKRSVS